VQADGREQEARRARRIVLGFRLAFYAVVLVAALVVLAKRGAADPAQPLIGKTAQDVPISMEVRDGRARAFDAQVLVTCPNGTSWPMRWWLRDDEVTPFRYDGTRLRVRGTDQRDAGTELAYRVFELDARVEDDRAQGVMTVVDHIRTVDGYRYRCASGEVAFTAQR
jgi:hypothetical protein